jgi:hypothetical protein
MGSRTEGLRPGREGPYGESSASNLRTWSPPERAARMGGGEHLGRLAGVWPNPRSGLELVRDLPQHHRSH